MNIFDQNNGPYQKKIDEFSKFLQSNKLEKSNVIMFLQKAQELFGYIPKEVINLISTKLYISEAEILGIITFYKHFRLKPVGKYIIRACDGTACHVNGSLSIIDTIKETLNLLDGDTTDDGLFTLIPVACLGCCSLAPVIMINSDTYGRLTPIKVREIIHEIKKNNSK